MKKWYFTAILACGLYGLCAQPATGCYELVEVGDGSVEVRFNVAATSDDSNLEGNNRVSRGEITLSWTGPGTFSNVTNGEYAWFPDGDTDNSAQFRFGPTNQPTTFTQGESVLLFTFTIDGGAGTININSSDLINVFNEDLASDDSCPTSFNFGSLPVNFSAFTADVIKEKDVKLWWKTAGELNNDFFAVEHSTDGEAFTEVGKVAGSGTIAGAQEYQFLHQGTFVGNNFYRLRQVDFDGTFAYSNIQSVKISAPGVLARAFPNPAAEQLILHFPSNPAGLRIQLVEATGRTRLVKTVDPQTLRTTLTVEQLPRGVYWLQIEREGTVSSQKIFLY
ncbi:MAG: T9SS type A sorting domain-containing protein [Bacteroidota bacterium]